MHASGVGVGGRCGEVGSFRPSIAAQWRHWCARIVGESCHKYHLCRDKHVYAGRDKTFVAIFVVTNICRDKHVCVRRASVSACVRARECVCVCVCVCVHACARARVCACVGACVCACVRA